MNVSTCLNILREIKDVAFATVDENNQPQVRIKHNSSMNNVYPNESRYILEAFCLEEGELEFFDLGKEPIYRESFSMNKEIKPKGFIISNQCIQCGLCQKNCLQQCISNYQIQQEHCLHCGLCYEKCPVQAIERRKSC